MMLIVKRKVLMENLAIWKTCILRQESFLPVSNLKRQGLIHSAWFFSNCIYINVGENQERRRYKI